LYDSGELLSSPPDAVLRFAERFPTSGTAPSSSLQEPSPVGTLSHFPTPQDAISSLGPLSEILVESAASIKIRELSALDELIRTHQDKVVIFGAGTLGRKAVQLLREIGIEPLALCDSSPKLWSTEVLGFSVLSPDDAAARFGSTAIFFVAIWNDFHWYRDTLARLTALHCLAVSSYAPLFWRFGDRFMDLRLLNEPPHRLYENLDDVLSVEGFWADSESLATYRSNILWRAKGDPSHLPHPAPQNTYFPQDLFRLIPEEKVVDCGAFDGDTIRLVLSVVGSRFEAIYPIEADAHSLTSLRACVAALPPETAQKIHVLECAVGSERSVLRFAMNGSANSRIDDLGVDVDCAPLDELFLNTPVTFIKMDIEGAEYDALMGGRQVIERDLPILAICVYHTQSDIWRIPLLIRSLVPEYHFFLRSYDGDGFQTVLYAVPPHRMLSEYEKSISPNPRKPVHPHASDPSFRP
jgi:FkbM family methyltransferase